MFLQDCKLKKKREKEVKGCFSRATTDVADDGIPQPQQPPQQHSMWRFYQILKETTVS